MRLGFLVFRLGTREPMDGKEASVGAMVRYGSLGRLGLDFD